MKIINLVRSTFFPGLMILLLANAKSQAPEPIAYYDFEGDVGNVVIDKSENGNDAEVTRPGQTTLGNNGGAPEGSSPSTSADFQDGLLNVPGIGLGNIISGSGSYTFTAWLKPSDLNGEKFLFGQTSQGIHNGIRNNGFLHQAHWGADTNGATNLNSYLAEDADGWIHAAWTYDGGSDIGKIYLDGKIDWEGNKSAPNGSGNLIIGGRNGGETGYVGLVDEIAIWDEVLSTEDISTLAQGGASPLGIEGTDDDDDGLPDWWEDKYDVDDPGADPDQDGLTNADEFEVNTNPQEADTDGDGFNDGTEIDEGSDPTNPNSVAGLPIPIAYYNFESKSTTASDQSFNDNIATATDLVDFVDEGAPTGPSPGSAAQLDGGHFRVPSIDMNSQIRDAGDGSYTMSAWIKPSELGGERFLFGQTSQGIHHGIRNNGFLHSAHWGADWNSNTNLGDYDPPENQGGWFHAAWVYDGSSDTAKMYLDGVLDGTNSQRAPNGGGHLIIGARNNGEAQYLGLLDEVAIWDKVISEGEILKLAQGGSPTASLADADKDGFIDAWEKKYAGNLTDLDGNNEEADYDKDGLTDAEEYKLRISDPTKSDSDDDGLDDFTEIDDGTDPSNADTDNDGLNDGAEITAKTDPTDPDTDGDGYMDGIEVVNGSDPNDDNSTPPPLLAYYDFEGDQGNIVKDKGNWGNDAEVTRPEQTYLGIKGGAPEGSSPTTAAEFNDGLINVPGINLSKIISGEGSYTFSAWLKPTNLDGDKFLFGQTNQGIHNGIRNNGFLHQAHWGADTNGATNLNDYLNNDLDGWIHAAWTYDGESDTGKIYLDGELDWEGAKRAPNGNGNLIIGGRNGGGAGYVGLIDEVAIWEDVRSEEFIASLANGANPNSREGVDADEDGLPDWWEDRYGVDDPDSDPDQDGLTNIDEFEEGTDPEEADTDDDGLNDGKEISLGTSPFLKDTDGDGLEDGKESEIGTNPTEKDTDGDSYSDQAEILAKTDPLDENSFPNPLMPILFYDFEGDDNNTVTDKSDSGNNAEVTRPNGTTLGVPGGAPSGSSPETGAEMNNGLLNVPGINLSKIINDNGSYTYTAWLKPTELGGDKFLWGQTVQGIHNGIRNGGFLHQAHWGADTNGATNLNDYLDNDLDGWIHAAWTYDGETDTGQIYLDGTLDWEGNKRAPNGSGNLIIGGRNGGEAGYVGLIDDIAVWNDVLAAKIIASLAEGASPIPQNNTDDDEDGLPDFWETKHAVDDPEADPDQDGLTNAEEYDNKTDPNKADSDEDGLDDGTEVAWKSSPLNKDTDSDGLSDSEEKAAGTDPTKDDTDEDGYSDLKEIESGSNPLNANSVPPAPPVDEPLFFYDFEGDEGDLVTDKAERGNDADVTRPGQTELGVPGGAPQGSSPGTAIEFNDGLLNVPGVEMAEIISGEGSYTMSAWLKPTNLGGDKFLFGQTSQGIHNGIRNGGFLHQAHWGADTNGATNLNGYLEADEDGWIHAAWTYDGETDTGKIYLDGSLDWEGSKRAPNGSGNLIIGGRNGGGNGYFGLADDIAMWDMTLEPEAIKELALGSSPIGSKLPFQITSITYDLQSGEIELTWESKPGRNYLLLYNTSLENWDADIDDSIESGGDSTTYRFENPEGPEAKALFFKVIEN